MTNPQNTTIAVLLASAVILASILIATRSADQAYADASVKGGSYIAVTGQVSTGMDFLYVIDIPQQRLNVYGYNTKTNMLELGQRLDLRRLFGR